MCVLLFIYNYSYQCGPQSLRDNIISPYVLNHAGPTLMMLLISTVGSVSFKINAKSNNMLLRNQTSNKGTRVRSADFLLVADSHVYNLHQ